MTIAYATPDELEERLSPTYAARLGDNAEQLIAKASEIIDYYTFDRAPRAWESEEGDDETPYRDALRKAACDQVEFWLEVGEEADVSGLKGSMVAGRVQVHPVPRPLGQRARRTLELSGLLYAGVAIQ